MNRTKKIKPLGIALLGTYPPPYGGRSIHIQRLKEQLDKNGIETAVHNIGGGVDIPDKNIIKIKNMKKWILQHLFSKKEDIIHYHGSNWKERAIVGLMSFLGKKTVITLHSSVFLKDDIEQGNRLKRLIIRFAIKHTSFIISLNPQIKELVLSLGVKPERVKVIPSFIPPSIREAEIAEIPKNVWDFIDSHSPMVSANAFKIVFYNNQDSYGIDMCIDLCANLKQSYPNIGFAFCLPEVGDYAYFEKMKQRIAEKGIENNFLFQTKPCQLYPIIMRSDVFARPTNTDGYGVSVAEAIYFKVPAVASDVCQRPEGTILFKCRDIDDFTLKVKAVLDNYEREVAKLEEVANIDYADKIMGIYRDLVGE